MAYPLPPKTHKKCPAVFRIPASHLKHAPSGLLQFVMTDYLFSAAYSAFQFICSETSINLKKLSVFYKSVLYQNTSIAVESIHFGFKVL